MGGDYEGSLDAGRKDKGNVLMPETPAAAVPTVGQLSQAIRYHISGGEVHFHVDPGKGPNTDKLKVAVPVAEWWTAWEQIKNLRTENYRYVDHINGCILEIESGVNEKREFEVNPRLSKIADGVGTIFGKLDEFSAQLRKKKG